MKRELENLYRKFNRREYVHPDPIEFLYQYEDVRDREVVGLVAAVLAYGRVAQILKSVQNALDRMESKPYLFLMRSSGRSLKSVFRGFKHRFTTGDDLSNLLLGAKNEIERHGSLGKSFGAGLHKGDETILPALAGFAEKLSVCGAPGHIFPTPRMSSACKRPNLYLRWMVRQDAVDPGGWEGVPLSLLVVPLDTHMHQIGLEFGFTKRRTADIETALEVTRVFGKIRPDDPVRYDFALTRFGIRDDMSIKRLPIQCRLARGRPFGSS